MKYRVVGFGALVAMVAVAWVPLAGQAPRAAEGKATTTEPWTHPRTPWGDPDLQGFWGGGGGLALERAKEFGGRELLTDAEVAEREKFARERDANRLAGTAEEQGFRSQGNYNAIFQGTPTLSPNFRIQRRTSAIIDPPNGRLPAWTPQQVKRFEAMQAATRGRGEADSYLDRALQERCIPVVTAVQVPHWGLGGEMGVLARARFADPTVGPVNGGDMARSWSGRILQRPGHVAMIEADEAEYRIIPVNGRPSLGPKIRQYKGEARGHWEGNTLVVVTTNVNDQQTNAGPFLPTYEQIIYPGSGETLRLVERFTRVGENAMEYRATIEDPEVYTRPYTVFFELRRNDDSVAVPDLCHEGNKDIAMIMANARADEAMSMDTAAESARDHQERLAKLKAEWAASNKSR
jgi:hypothetical protein